MDKNNRLLYWLNKPSSWRREYRLPERIIFNGGWQLNKNYDLELMLDKTEKQFQDDILVIKGNIISTDRDTLAFEIKTYDQNGLLHIQIIKLSGAWLTDETNRLKFIVTKRSPDILTLEGDWQINDNQEITYSYEKNELKTKTKISHTLTFEGFWQITSANKLTYILSGSSNSRFDFRVQIESPNLYPQEGVIKYRLGVGIKGQSPCPAFGGAQGTVPKIISLYGTWKFNRKLGLIFEMDYARGKVYEIEFGADISLDQKNKIIFALKNKTGEPLHFDITFAHKFLKKVDAGAFLRIGEYFRKETAVEAGFSIPF